MRCVAKGTMKNILHFSDILQKKVKCGEVELPESQDSRAVCTAVFDIKDTFVDIKEFNKFYWLYLKFEFSTCEYVKPSKSCTGSWSKEKNLKENRGCESLLQSATVEENDTSFIGEFEDLESWERRNYGRFDD